MERLWDQAMADKAAAIDQAVKLGGRVIEPPRSTGFTERLESLPSRPPAYAPLPCDD